MDLDDNNVNDLYRVARRKLPEGIAQAYWDATLNRQDPEEYDPTEAKAVVAALALQPEVVEAVEAAAEQLVRSWLRQHQRSISALPDARRVAYEPVKREARDSELTDLVAPGSLVVRDAETRWARHVLAAEDGTYPCPLGGWERKVLERELADEDLVAWYRNPTGGPNALRVPYQGEQRDRPMYPDFLLFHRTDQGLLPSIVDPHGYHLTGSAGRLQGLATYAERHGATYARVEAVAEVDGTLLALDLKSEAVRRAVAGCVDDEGVRDLYKEHGGSYS